ncbi:MAG: hypothetical protein MUC96_20825 [Myxococcaceae bacterium]|nr:hypothetical protein [Myxococcaceae bacterium]
MAVIVGNLCGRCGAPAEFTPARQVHCTGVNSAINLTEVGRYNADYSAVRGACLPDFTACPLACGAPTEAFCSAGTCSLRPSPRL